MTTSVLPAYPYPPQAAAATTAMAATVALLLSTCLSRRQPIPTRRSRLVSCPCASASLAYLLGKVGELLRIVVVARLRTPDTLQRQPGAGSALCVYFLLHGLSTAGSFALRLALPFACQKVQCNNSR